MRVSAAALACRGGDGCVAGVRRRGVGRSFSRHRLVSPSTSTTKTASKRRHQVVSGALPVDTAWLADNAVLQAMASTLSLGGEVARNMLPWPLSAIASTLCLDLSSALLGEVTQQALLHFFVSPSSPQNAARSRLPPSTGQLTPPGFSAFFVFCRRSTTSCSLRPSPLSVFWTTT